MVAISLILPTAREDYTIIGLPKRHILEHCIESLKKQTFTDFELIVVDCIFQERPSMFKGKPFKKQTFQVKHVPIHPNHTFWLKRKRPCAAAAVNTGIIHAQGELLVKIDDCCMFDKEYLAKIWSFYQKGFFPLSLYTKYRAGKQAYFTKDYRETGGSAGASDVPSGKDVSDPLKMNQRLKLYGDGGPVIDSRWKIVQSRGRIIAPHSWFYGYGSLSLEAALKINGMDELFDGDTTLMDVDLGERLVMAGFRNMFLLDKNLWVIEHEHEAISSLVRPPACGNIKCNYAIMLVNKRRRRWRANTDKLSDKELQFVKEETLRFPCQWNPHQYLDDCEGEMFNLFSENQPIFNLREERLDV